MSVFARYKGAVMHSNCLMCFQLITVRLDVLQHETHLQKQPCLKAEGQEKPMATEKQRLNLTKKEKHFEMKMKSSLFIPRGSFLK